MRNHQTILRLSALLLSALLLCLASCSIGEECKYRVDDTAGGRICEVYAKNGSATRIRVTKDGKELFKESVKADKSVGDRGGNYGFEILDLNFDGLNDLKIATKVQGDQVSEICFLQTADGGYVQSTALEGFCNIGTDPEQKAVFSFRQTRTDEPAVGDTPACYVLTDTVTAYVWQGDALKPYRRISLSYHSEENIYMYSVSDYSDAIHDFLEPDDRFFTPEQYAKTDFSAFYYFK